MPAEFSNHQDLLQAKAGNVFAAKVTDTVATRAVSADATPSAPAAFLTAQTAIPASTLTPTVTEFLNGAVSEYVLGGTPTGMTPFTVNGTQLSYHDDTNGAVSHVWLTAENQVLISFAGTTGGEHLLTNPLLTAGGLISDLQILGQQVSTAQIQSLAFAKTVITAANAQGYANSQIFVTGHSLGGIEASYVAQQTGLGGIAFEATGIPADPRATGTGANFVSVVTNGDPVANYSTDIRGEQPFAPAYVPPSQGGGSYAHYGTILQIGSDADQAALSAAARLITNPFTAALGVVGAAALIAEFHLPKSLYTDLNVTATGNLLATPPSNLGVAHGAVLPVSGDTIGQLQAYISTHATTTA